MPRLLTVETKVHLEKARDSALLAVETYNRPGASFRSGGFIVLMCIAWTSLLHAVFFKRKKKPFYRKRTNPRHFEQIDGDKKAWELSTCAKEFWPESSTPARRNIEFFIGLRNKVEHRSMPALDMDIFGECQALLFNFEDVLEGEFGAKYALNESLSMALQFSCSRNEHQERAVRKLHRSLAKNIRLYVDTFRSSLSTDVAGDLRYSYKVFLIPKTANHEKSSDFAVEFIKFDATKPEEMLRYEQIVSLVKPTGTASLKAVADTKTSSTTAIRLVTDANAPVYGVVDFDATHPLQQKSLLAIVNDAIPVERKINQYHLRAIRNLFDIDSQHIFFHQGKFASPQYSKAFAEWLIARQNEDQGFFEQVKKKFGDKERALREGMQKAQPASAKEQTLDLFAVVNA